MSVPIFVDGGKLFLSCICDFVVLPIAKLTYNIDRKLVIRLIFEFVVYMHPVKPRKLLSNE